MISSLEFGRLRHVVVGSRVLVFGTPSTSLSPLLSVPECSAVCVIGEDFAILDEASYEKVERGVSGCLELASALGDDSFDVILACPSSPPDISFQRLLREYLRPNGRMLWLGSGISMPNPGSFLGRAGFVRDSQESADSLFPSYCASGASRPEIVALRLLASRLARQAKGVRLLKEVLRSEFSRHADALEDRNRTIREAQLELHSKVEECNRIIQALQEELHQKTGARDRIIQDLQRELQAKVGERDDLIRSLQSELHSKVSECNRIIQSLRKQNGPESA